MLFSKLKYVLALILLIPAASFAQEFGTVNFKFDSDQLDSEGQRQVSEIAEKLKSVQSYKPTVVVGYTDAVGTSSYNLDLGQRRANRVASALIALGVPVDRIGSTSSRGKNDLLIAVATAERQNRRVTVKLEDILAACRSYREITLSQDAIGDELQTDLSTRLSEAVAYYEQFTNSGNNGPAFQMAGAAREDCSNAVGLDRKSVRKIEYAKKCFCNSARLRVALGQ